MSHSDVKSVIREEYRGLQNQEPYDINILNSDNRLSTVYTVDNKYIVKKVTPYNRWVHNIIAYIKNKMFSRHTSYDIFDYYSSKEDMIEYEYNTLDLYSQKNINCPDPIKISHKKDFSLLFIEYIKSSIKFNRINRFEKQYKRVEYISNLFRDVKQINEYWSHGDLQPDNILRSNGILYYIDPMKVNAFCDFSYIYDVASCIVTACEIERQDIIAEICKTEFQDELLKKVADIIIPVAIQMGQKTSSIGIRKYIR